MNVVDLATIKSPPKRVNVTVEDVKQIDMFDVSSLSHTQYKSDTQPQEGTLEATLETALGFVRYLDCVTAIYLDTCVIDIYRKICVR